jgi:RNA polymerase sigma factor (sigma-70 family)
MAESVIRIAPGRDEVIEGTGESGRPMDPADLASRLEPLHPDGFGWALSCCGRDREAAQEVIQMTYLKILTGKARYDGRSSAKTWLFSVIRKTAAEHRRSRWRDAINLSRLWRRRAETAGDAGPESALAGSERARLLHEALTRLSRRQREVLHLVFYQGLTVESAAEVLGVAPGTARLHYERGKSRLRQLLPREARP